MAIISRMEVSIAEAKNRLPELIRAMEGGEAIVITRHGKPVAQLAPAPHTSRVVKFGTLLGRFRLQPGWDDPISIDQFLAGEV